MNKTKKDRAVQMALGTFVKDDFSIRIYPPTFPSISAAYAYFTRNADKFQEDFEDDSDDDYLNAKSQYQDTQDFFDEMIESTPPSSSTFANKAAERGIEEDDKRGTSAKDDDIPKAEAETLKEE